MNSHSSAKRSARSRASACTPSRSVASWPAATKWIPSSRAVCRLGSSGSPVRKRSIALVRRLDQLAAGAAGADRDPLDPLRPVGEDERLAPAHRLADAGDELVDARRLAQTAALADLARRAARPRRRAHRRGGRCCRSSGARRARGGTRGASGRRRRAPRSRPRWRRSIHERLVPPEHPVVDDQQLRARRGRSLEQLERGRDAARDLADLVRAEHLQPRPSVLGEAVHLEQLVRVRRRCRPGEPSGDYRYPLRARGVAQPGSALRSGRRGPEFKSPHPD